MIVLIDVAGLLPRRCGRQTEVTIPGQGAWSNQMAQQIKEVLAVWSHGEGIRVWDGSSV